MTTRGILSGVLAAAVALALGAGCTRNGPAPGTKTFRVATFTWVGYAPLHLAKEKDLFKGVHVELTSIDDTGSRRAALSSGKVDGSVDILDSFIVARASGLPAKVALKLDDSMGGDGIVVKKEIKTLKDLRGRTVAFAKDQPSHFFLAALLEKEGMSMKDVVKKEMAEADQAGSAFVSGSVDAAVTWEPWLSKAAKMPNARVLTTSKETPGLIVDVFTVRDDYLRDNPDAVKAFVQGWFAAVQYWRDHPDEANTIMARALKLERKELEDMLKGIRYSDRDDNRTFFTPADETSPFTRLVGRANEIWQGQGLIKKAVDARRSTAPAS